MMKKVKIQKMRKNKEAEEEDLILKEKDQAK